MKLLFPNIGFVKQSPVSGNTGHPLYFPACAHCQLIPNNVISISSTGNTRTSQHCFPIMICKILIADSQCWINNSLPTSLWILQFSNTGYNDYTVVSRASAHSRVSAHVTVLAARIKSAHSRASAQVT